MIAAMYARTSIIKWANLVLTMMLAAGTSSALATECAWVLWLSQEVSGNVAVVGGVTRMHPWHIVETYDQLQECRQRREVELKRQEEELSKVVVDSKWIGRPEPQAVRQVTKSGLVTNIFLYCLPGSLDPRGHEFDPKIKFPETK